MSIVPPLTAADQAAYVATMRRSDAAHATALAERHARALEAATAVAKCLRERYGATDVRLFGSLAHGLWYTEYSDIDIAAWGLRMEEYFGAVAICQDVAEPFSVDLVDMARCPERLCVRIDAESVPL